MHATRPHATTMKSITAAKTIIEANGESRFRKQRDWCFMCARKRQVTNIAYSMHTHHYFLIVYCSSVWALFRLNLTSIFTVYCRVFSLKLRPISNACFWRLAEAVLLASEVGGRRVHVRHNDNAQGICFFSSFCWLFVFLLFSKIIFLSRTVTWTRSITIRRWISGADWSVRPASANDPPSSLWTCSSEGSFLVLEIK